MCEPTPYIATHYDLFNIDQIENGDLIHKLLLKVLAGQEELKQTLRLHSSMLHKIVKQQNVAKGLAKQELPDELSFPITNLVDVDAVEAKLKDTALQKILVIFV